MSTVLEQRCAPLARPRRWGPSLLVLGALALLYAPTCFSFAHGLWRDDEYAHAPIVLALSAWLAWRERAALLDAAAAPSPLAGGALLALGLALYAVGRSQSIALFEAASVLPVVAGLVLMMRGGAALRRFAFPLAFLAFSVPIPGFILAAVSAPLKEFVSTIVALLLGAMGYPVVRDGVVLDVGTHRLLLADACAGLNSLTALFAIVALYGHLTGGLARRRAWLLLAAVVPIAVAANTVRVLALALIACHYGDETAQGFVHGVAGLLVFAVALGLLLAIDLSAPSPLGEGGGEGDEPRPSSRPSPKGEGGFAPSPLGEGRGEGGSPRRGFWRAAIAAAAMAGVAFATPALRPVPAASPINLETMVPARFGGWRIDTSIEPIAPAADVQERVDRLYEQVLTRTYVNAAGEQMMLTIAYGGDQSDALKVHRQEACYAAQGFTIHGLAHGRIDVAGRSVPATRMLAVRGERSEPVTYWFTMGDRVVLGRFERLRTQLAAGLAGRIPDGMLVRVSSLSTDAPAAFEAQRSFLDALVGAVPAADAARLAGARRG